MGQTKRPAEALVKIDEEFLTTRELSELLKTSQSNLLLWRRDGQGPPYVQVGRYIRYRLSAVEAWLRDQEIG